MRTLPNEDAIPEKPKIIHAKLNQIIIPRVSGNKDGDHTLSDRYYIWRAIEDYKTRDQHAANSGKIFDSHNPPPCGNAGEDYNCRCTADFNIPNWVKIEGTLNNKYIVRKYITDLTTLPNFVIKCGCRELNFRS